MPLLADLIAAIAAGLLALLAARWYARSSVTPGRWSTRRCDGHTPRRDELKAITNLGNIRSSSVSPSCSWWSSSAIGTAGRFSSFSWSRPARKRQCSA
jgi:hypothetical protein